MALTDDELRDVLARAEEIQRSTRFGAEWKAEVAAVTGAAQEVGYSRRAVERALSERFSYLLAPPTPGTLIWARSSDGKFYVAEVLSAVEDSADVRFLGGAEHRVTMDQLRPCAFIPGERVVVDWPWWGPWTCSVVAYDPGKKRVKLSDGWGTTKTFPISQVWLAPSKADAGAARRRVYAMLASGAGIGALVGSLLTALLMG
jgi:hypothetical protein